MNRIKSLDQALAAIEAEGLTWSVGIYPPRMKVDWSHWAAIRLGNKYFRGEGNSSLEALRDVWGKYWRYRYDNRN